MGVSPKTHRSKHQRSSDTAILEDTARGVNQDGKLDSPTAAGRAAAAATAAWAAVQRSTPAPNVTHATGTRVVKGEDVMFVHTLGIAGQPPSTMMMVCDGHSGIDAASFVSTHFLRLLNTKLPNKLPDFSRVKEMDEFAENVRKALCQTFFHLDNEWSLGGLHSGCTCTVALVTGWLLTVANVGDSSAVLDTGASLLELTKSHRLQESVEEQVRLKKASVELAPLGFHLQGPAKPGEIGVGPLRLWPGGLCVARSVGDLDAGPEVLPLPNIRQVIMPTHGCRLIMASDGLWDVLTLSKACTLTRAKTTNDAAACLMTAVSRDLRVMDDTTVLVIDALPADVAGWPSVALRAEPNGARGGGVGLCACFRPEEDEPDSRDVLGRGHLTYLADVDTLKVYPSLKAMLNRTMIYQSYRSQQSSGAPKDFTLHGALPWRTASSGVADRSAATRSSSGGSGHLKAAVLRDSNLSLSRILSNPAIPANALIAHDDDPSRRSRSELPPTSLYGGADVGVRGGYAAAAALSAAAGVSAHMSTAAVTDGGGSTSTCDDYNFNSIPNVVPKGVSDQEAGRDDVAGGGAEGTQHSIGSSGRAGSQALFLLDADSIMDIDTVRPVRMQSKFAPPGSPSGGGNGKAPIVRAPQTTGVKPAR